ncbi:MAG: hypothetical protein IT445_07635 [Phycisphaeraceae bacterium]|nr:hypothetical protein [Phycisphaeraceae bacterium]
MTLTPRHRVRPLFTPRELGRVGAATAIMVFGGTTIVLLMLMLLGHYSSLSHCGPKALLDGAVIALLAGQKGRWRCVALLGAVYGLVLLIQVGVPYLPLVLAIAGLLGAVGGAAGGAVHRRLGILLAAMLFEWGAGLGAPLKIYFGTSDANEPFLWGLWVAEWPLRLGGAAAGALLAGRLTGKADGDVVVLPTVRRDADARRRRVRGVRPAALRLSALLAASIVPLMLERWDLLIVIFALTLAYALWLGPRQAVLWTLPAVAWGWFVFTAASYLWHRDPARVVDLLRTFALRFGPMALASVVLVSTARPVDVWRVLRRMSIPGAGMVLLPLAVVLRQIPHTGREIRQRLTLLRRHGHWRGPLSLLRRPRLLWRELFSRPLRRFADQLAE